MKKTKEAEAPGGWSLSMTLFSGRHLCFPLAFMSVFGESATFQNCSLKAWYAADIMLALARCSCLLCLSAALLAGLLSIRITKHMQTAVPNRNV